MVSAGDALFDDPAFARFYDIENEWTSDQEAVTQLAEGARSVLDLGCGTGRLLRHLGAQGKRCVGVDPASAMLDIARQGPEGAAVQWINADARAIDLDERFDLIAMTGHAFQCFLTPEDRLAVLRGIARHLAPDGRFIFDSRNPAAREWLEWGKGESFRTFDDPELGPISAWNEAWHDPETGIVTYETHYQQSDGQRQVATSRIAFPDRAELTALLDHAGLEETACWGEWDGRPWASDSLEIVLIGGKKRI